MNKTFANLSRRQFGLGLGALAAGACLPTVAKSPVNVVKILSFSCGFCRESEVHDATISRVVGEYGGRFVWAPIPTHPEDFSGAKERLYYAARDIDARLGDAVKNSLYKGTQDQGQVLFDYMPLYAWLTGDLPQFESKMAELFEKAKAPAALGAMQRAIRLALSAGVDAVPNYLLIRDGQVIASYDRVHPQAPTLSALRELVVEAVRRESKE